MPTGDKTIRCDADKKDALYRKVVRKTWRRKRFRALSEVDKLVLLYLWTAPDSVNPGIYYINIPTVADDLRYDSGIIRESFLRLAKDNWFWYDMDERVVFFPKWTEYDPPYNKNVVVSYLRWANELAQSKLSAYFLWTLKPFVESYGLSFGNHTGMIPEPLPQSFGIQEQLQEQEQIQGAVEKKKAPTSSLAPTAPLENLIEKTPDQMRAELAPLLGWNGSKKKELCFGDYMLAIRDWLCAVYPGANSESLKIIAGNITKTIAKNAFGKPEQYHKSWPPIVAFTEFLNLSIGEPREGGGLLDGRKCPAKPNEIYRFVNQIFTDPQQAHEFAHAAYHKAGLV